ncbi:hypothetical protein FRC02_005815 [Tulasnella sp. 418]|nr:hypothetical protein FRC02_005815 [Tulasnella sp. 418]
MSNRTTARLDTLTNGMHGDEELMSRRKLRHAVLRTMEPMPLERVTISGIDAGPDVVEQLQAIVSDHGAEIVVQMVS